jgi:hypothetical protein
MKTKLLATVLLSVIGLMLVLGGTSYAQSFDDHHPSIDYLDYGVSASRRSELALRTQGNDNLRRYEQACCASRRDHDRNRCHCE